jgi:hypothetical protein
MRQTEFSRTVFKVSGIVIAALVLGGCLEGETSDQDSGFTDTNEPPANVAPVISGTPARNVTIGEMYSFLPDASDADGDSLTFFIDNKPTWASFNSNSGELSGRPSLGDIGNHNNIRISVSDGTATMSLSAFSISVADISAGNSAPTISGTPRTSVVVGAAYSFIPTASDADGDALTFSIANRPAWASFNATTGELTGTPDGADVGVYANVTISVSDGQASVSLAPFSIQVTDVATNAPPSISGAPPTTVEAGSVYNFVPVASDPDGDALTFSVTNRPAWASFSTTTGELLGRPANGDSGVYPNITISVSDGKASASLGPFAIEVIKVNTAPTIAGTPPTSVEASSAYRFMPTASDADGDTLTFSIMNRPAWASFDTSSGLLSGTPTDRDVGVYSNITISVSDGQASDTLRPFSIEVLEPDTNSAPTISGTPATSVDAGNTYSFTPVADDADGDALTFSIAARPAWASFDRATGALSGTPDNADVGVYSNIVISVSDGQDSASLAPFAIEVIGANRAPTISGTPASGVDAGSTYSFTPSANDPDGDALTFSITNQPQWASFSTATGTVSGTPADTDVGDYESIAITVSDGQESATLGPFTITVNPVVLGSITLSWTPPTRNEDGSALTDLAGYKFYWGTTPGVYTDSVTINNPGLSSYVVENLRPGTYEFVGTAFNEKGEESAYSNPTTMVLSQ